MGTPLKTHAIVTHLTTKEVFYSDEDDQLTATVKIENDSEIKHSCQIVFRGYVRSKTALLYEFLHEQVWVVAGHGSSSHDVEIDAWLNRFPPTMQINNDLVVEYSVRATIDPWFSNTHKEHIFKVKRMLTLKQPHVACSPLVKNVNECIGHGGWCHRKCEPMNGQMILEKGAYSFGEEIVFRWNLVCDSPVTEAHVSLIKTYEFRHADPGHPMQLEHHSEEICAEHKQLTSEGGEESITLRIPDNIPTSIEMSLWNVISIKYDVLLKLKPKSQKKWVELHNPMLITTEPVQPRRHATKERRNLYKRAHDVGDDSADDDDYDSEIEEGDQKQEGEYSIDIEELKIHVPDGGDLANAQAEVKFVMNSKHPRPLRSLRLLLTGECRAGMVWYDFLRYKSIVTTNPDSAFTPGEHSIKVRLPFLDSQYDTHILPPTMGEDVKYTVRVSVNTWRINSVECERDLFVSRHVDTWAREEFKSGFSEKMGMFGMTMEQRCYQKGKWIFCKVYGPAKTVKLSLVQQRRLRQPGLNVDESYCTERVVSNYESPEDQDYWPEEWALQIPKHICPSIEVSYWNVVVVSYVFTVISYADDGHEHKHTVPVWIGSSDDKLGPPKVPVKKVHDATTRTVSPTLGELPAFEVVNKEEVHEHPYWVNRLNNDTYNTDPIVDQ